MKNKDMKVLAINSNSIKVLDAIKECISENIQFEIDDKLNIAEKKFKKIDQLDCGNKKTKKFMKKK